jgi:N-glycosylase/DNA lyase
VMLFGYHRLDAFPRDVWISRVLANEYPRGFPFERFCGFAGIVQQYMFCFARSSKYKKMQEYRENTAISSN